MLAFVHIWVLSVCLRIHWPVSKFGRLFPTCIYILIPYVKFSQIHAGGNWIPKSLEIQLNQQFFSYNLLILQYWPIWYWNNWLLCIHQLYVIWLMKTYVCAVIYRINKCENVYEIDSQWPMLMMCIIVLSQYSNRSISVFWLFLSLISFVGPLTFLYSK